MAASEITGIPEVDARILEIRDRQRDDVIAPPGPLPEILDLRRRLRTQLEPIFAQAGPEVEAIKRILTEYRRDLQKIVSARRSQSSAEPSAQSKSRRRRTRPSHTFKPATDNYLITPILIQDASLIYAKPVDMITASGASEPPEDNDWAQISYWSDTDTSLSYNFLRFYYFWTCEPPDNGLPISLINVNASGSINGYIGAAANEGLNNQTWINGGTYLSVFLPEDTGPAGWEGTPFPGTAIDYGGPISGESSELYLDYGFDISVGNLNPNPGDVLVIEVEVVFWSSIDDGSVHVSAFEAIVDPGVIIEIYQSLT
jgi:hypothetical protein